MGGSNLRPAKLKTVLSTARHRCNVSSKRAGFPQLGATTRKWPQPTCCTLRPNASIMKNLIVILINTKISHEIISINAYICK